MYSNKLRINKISNPLLWFRIENKMCHKMCKKIVRIQNASRFCKHVEFLVQNPFAIGNFPLLLLPQNLVYLYKIWLEV